MEIVMLRRTHSKDKPTAYVIARRTKYIAAKNAVETAYNDKYKEYIERRNIFIKSLGKDLPTHKISQTPDDFKYVIDTVEYALDLNTKPYMHFYDSTLLSDSYYSDRPESEWAMDFDNAEQRLIDIQADIDKWEYVVKLKPTFRFPTQYDTFELAQAALKVIIEEPCNYYGGPPMKEVTV